MGMVSSKQLSNHCLIGEWEIWALNQGSTLPLEGSHHRLPIRRYSNRSRISVWVSEFSKPTGMDETGESLRVSISLRGTLVTLVGRKGSEASSRLPASPPIVRPVNSRPDFVSTMVCRYLPSITLREARYVQAGRDQIERQRKSGPGRRSAPRFQYGDIGCKGLR